MTGPLCCFHPRLDLPLSFFMGLMALSAPYLVLAAAVSSIWPSSASDVRTLGTRSLAGMARRGWWARRRLYQTNVMEMEGAFYCFSSFPVVGVGRRVLSFLIFESLAKYFSRL